MDPATLALIKRLVAGAKLEVAIPVPSTTETLMPTPSTTPLSLEWHPIWPENKNADEIDLNTVPAAVIPLPASSQPSPNKIVHPQSDKEDSLEALFKEAENPKDKPTSWSSDDEVPISTLQRRKEKGKQAMVVDLEDSSHEFTPVTTKDSRKRKLNLSSPSPRNKSIRRSTRGSRQRVMEVDMTERGLVKEVIFPTEFLTSQSLGVLLGLLRCQQWENVFGVEELVDDEVVKKFYACFKLEKKSTGLVATYNLAGIPCSFTSHDLSLVLGVPHDGYGEYTGKNWPEGISCDEVMRTISGTPNPGPTVPTTQMSATVRLLHSFVVKNVVPRGEKGSVLQTQEAVLMYKMLRREKINLAMIIMLHMDHIRESHSHRLGYPSVVKRMLMHHGAYQTMGEEITWSRVLTEGTIKQMGFYYVRGKGWIKDIQESSSVPPPIGTNQDMMTLLRLEFARLYHYQGELEKTLLRMSDRICQIQDDIRDIKANIPPST